MVKHDPTWSEIPKRSKILETPEKNKFCILTAWAPKARTPAAKKEALYHPHHFYGSIFFLCSFPIFDGLVYFRFNASNGLLLRSFKKFPSPLLGLRQTDLLLTFRLSNHFFNVSNGLLLRSFKEFPRPLLGFRQTDLLVVGGRRRKEGASTRIVQFLFGGWINSTSCFSSTFFDQFLKN